jgi:DNA-binding winged helix-turn-helix (wHTH) protein
MSTREKPPHPTMSDTRNSVLRFGAFEANLATGELRKNGRTVNLQPQPFKLLVMLLQRQGELVTREEIQQKLWGEDTFVEFGQGLNFAINKIRQALGDDANQPRYVETLPRRGYRFIGQLQRREGDPIPRDASWQPPTSPQNQVIPNSDGVKAPLESTHAKGAASVAIDEVATQLRVSGVPALPAAPLPADRTPAVGPWFPVAVAVESRSAAHVPVVPAKPRRIRRGILFVCVGLALVAALVFCPVVPPPKVSRIRQITHIGGVLYNTRLLTDGPRVYFRAWDKEGKHRDIFTFRPRGAKSFPWRDPFRT